MCLGGILIMPASCEKRRQERRGREGYRIHFPNVAPVSSVLPPNLAMQNDDNLLQLYWLTISNRSQIAAE